MRSLAALRQTFAVPGRVAWIGLRPARRTPLIAVPEAVIEAEGLRGDHARPGKRAVTLIQSEHLPVVAALLRRERIDPALLRRNIVISGINLQALKETDFAVGGAVLRIAAPCSPCSRMEEVLGTGGYTAMRGHGGWCCTVVQAGPIRIGDPVQPVPERG